jgi:hypothetical protein
VITETRDVTGFDEVALFGSGDVVIEVTGTESLTVEADDNLLPLLETTVRNGRLELSTKASVAPTRGIKYTITVVTLEGVSVSGSGNVVAAGVDSPEFSVDISGSGKVSPAGAADELSVVIAGSGRYGGEDLVADNATVEVSGSGAAVVNATDRLDVDISGSGHVEYIGNPSVTESISGSGDLRRR